MNYIPRLKYPKSRESWFVFDCNGEPIPVVEDRSDGKLSPNNAGHFIPCWNCQRAHKYEVHQLFAFTYL